jgi:hypothetical protein
MTKILFFSCAFLLSINLNSAECQRLQSGSQGSEMSVVKGARVTTPELESEYDSVERSELDSSPRIEQQCQQLPMACPPFERSVQGLPLNAEEVNRQLMQEVQASKKAIAELQGLNQALQNRIEQLEDNSAAGISSNKESIDALRLVQHSVVQKESDCFAGLKKVLSKLNCFKSCKQAQKGPDDQV